MQFLSENFSLNGISSDIMGVILITFDDDVLRDFGNIYKQDLSIDGNLNNKPFYSNSITDGEYITLNLLLVEKDNVTPLKWTKESISMISNWVISENFQPFVSEDNLDIVYYLKCTNINKKFTNDMTGYLECTFKLFNNTAYYKSNIVFNVNGFREVDITNVGNSDYKPIIKVTNNSNSDARLSLNNTELILDGLNSNDTIIIDNKMKTVCGLDGRNRLSCCNRKWLSLRQGVNTLQVNGNCSIEVISEFPIGV